MKLPEIENCWLGLGLLGFSCGSTQPTRYQNYGRGDLAPTNRAGRPRPYDDEGFLGLRGLCVVGIVFCLNQDGQDYQIFRSLFLSLFQLPFFEPVVFQSSEPHDAIVS